MRYFRESIGVVHKRTTDFYEPSEVGEGRVDVSLAKIVCIARIASPTKEIMTGVSRYFQHAHFILIMSVEKRGAYSLVHSDLPRQHLFGTTLP